MCAGATVTSSSGITGQVLNQIIGKKGTASYGIDAGPVAASRVMAFGPRIRRTSMVNLDTDLARTG